MKPFWLFQLISIPIIFISGIAMFIYDPRLYGFWFNISFFLWNWGSCYYLAPGLEKIFERSLKKEELWTRFKRFVTNVRS